MTYPTSQICNVSRFFQVNLCFKEESIKAIKEELPGKNLPVTETVVKLVERL